MSLGVAKRSYLTSEVRGSGLECQAVKAQGRPRGATLRLRSVAEAGRRHPVSEVRVVARRSYHVSEASGGQEETLHVRGQGLPGEATLRPRPGAVTRRSHPEPAARSGSWDEPPTPEARARGRRSNPRSSG